MIPHWPHHPLRGTHVTPENLANRSFKERPVIPASMQAIRSSWRIHKILFILRISSDTTGRGSSCMDGILEDAPLEVAQVQCQHASMDHTVSKALNKPPSLPACTEGCWWFNGFVMGFHFILFHGNPWKTRTAPHLFGHPREWPWTCWIHFQQPSPGSTSPRLTSYQHASTCSNRSFKGGNCFKQNALEVIIDLLPCQVFLKHRNK